MKVFEITEIHRRSDNNVPLAGLLYHDFEDINIKLNSPEKVFNLTNDKSLIQSNSIEEHILLLMVDAGQNLLGYSEVSHGGFTISVVDMKSIFIRTLYSGAVGFILVHNHPSGDPTPSLADDSTTEKIKNSADILGFEFNDHIIIGNNTYYSYRKEGKL